jgi:hypothetical protein
LYGVGDPEVSAITDDREHQHDKYRTNEGELDRRYATLVFPEAVPAV